MPAKDICLSALSSVSGRVSQIGTICIEGNVGCGKTTLLDFFQRDNFSKLGRGIFMEPVESWRNVGGENLFQYLYKDPARYSLAFQTYVQLTMMKLHQKKPQLMERSIFSARYCFVENLYRMNYLSRLEYNILDKWFKHLVLGDEDMEFPDIRSELKALSQPKGVSIDLIIYLRCSPEKVMERIRQRSRVEEKGITFEYIKSLHDLHEDWLIHGKYPVPAPVLVLDTNCTFESLELIYQKAASYITGETKIINSPTVISVPTV